MNNASWPPWTNIHHNDDDENVRTLWWYEHSVQFRPGLIVKSYSGCLAPPTQFKRKRGVKILSL